MNFNLGWKTISLEGTSYLVAAQAKKMDCGVACLAMILKRFKPLNTYDKLTDLPGYSNLLFSESAGIKPVVLVGYMKKYVTVAAKEYNYIANTPSTILDVLHNATNNKPAVVVIQGHFMLCVGLSTVAANFRILDPKGGVGRICYMSVHGPQNRIIKLNSTGCVPVQLQGVLSTAPPTPPQRRRAPPPPRRRKAPPPPR